MPYFGRLFQFTVTYEYDFGKYNNNKGPDKGKFVADKHTWKQNGDAVTVQYIRK